MNGGGTLTVMDGAGVSTTIPACYWGASLPAGNADGEHFGKRPEPDGP